MKKASTNENAAAGCGCISAIIIIAGIFSLIFSAKIGLIILLCGVFGICMLPFITLYIKQRRIAE